MVRHFNPWKCYKCSSMHRPDQESIEVFRSTLYKAWWWTGGEGCTYFISIQNNHPFIFIII